MDIYKEAHRALKIAMLRKQPRAVIARKRQYVKAVEQVIMFANKWNNIRNPLLRFLFGYYVTNKTTTMQEFQRLHARYVNEVKLYGR